MPENKEKIKQDYFPNTSHPFSTAYCKQQAKVMVEFINHNILEILHEISRKKARKSKKYMKTARCACIIFYLGYFSKTKVCKKLIV